MNYFKIKKYDIANGKGIRTSLFVSGCTFHCKGCFNSEAWDFKSGKPFDDNAKKELFELLSDPHCVGLSVLGGEPLMQGQDLLDLLKEVKEVFPDKNIWLWTGFYINELNDLQTQIISLVDYVVDGRFEENNALKKYLFRGSSNQTIWEKDEKGNFVRSKYNDI